MLSRQDRENLYKKAAKVCEVNIYESTPAFFYGTFCKTLVKDPAKYGLPSQLGINRASYQIWKYKKVTLECCDYFFNLPFHPRCSVALRWYNIVNNRVRRHDDIDTKMGLIAAGYSPVKVFRSGFNADVKLTNAEYTEFLDALNSSKEHYASLEEKLNWNPAWFLVWKHVPAIDNYYRPRSRKIINYVIRHKEWFNNAGNYRRIDEIFDNDITDISLKPEHLFKRIDERRNPLVKFPKFPYSLTDGISYVDDSRKLKAEGLRMHHCVANYSQACAAGNTFILKLPNSTAEINTSGNVNQHRGLKNSPPSEEDRNLLQKWKHERRRIVDKTATEVLNERTNIIAGR